MSIRRKLGESARCHHRLFDKFNREIKTDCEVHVMRPTTPTQFFPPFPIELYRYLTLNFVH
jgi:hypothetical protein